ncbi:MAG: cyclic nucleotide-binding domain-containing protein [Planctomycetaceae bacterium]|nr:cyclic nucleotide-binding domain-containing protein [Planctomycetaceae bacterium]
MLTRDFLRTVELFAPLSDKDADALIGIGREEIFQKGQVVFRERDPGAKLYLVLSGVVEIAKSGVSGAPAMSLARLGRGEILGEIAAFDGGPRSATAMAAVVQETRLFAWEMVDFNRYLAARPQAALIILSGLLKKLGTRLRKTSEAVQTLVRAL